jgi:hypothetical protein
VISSEESRPPYVGSAVPDDGDSLFSIETGLQEASGDIYEWLYFAIHLVGGSREGPRHRPQLKICIQNRIGK